MCRAARPSSGQRQFPWSTFSVANACRQLNYDKPFPELGLGSARWMQWRLVRLGRGVGAWVAAGRTPLLRPTEAIGVASLHLILG